MTTKPKARRFRIRPGALNAGVAGMDRPSAKASDSAANETDPSLPTTTEDGFGNTSFPGSAKADEEREQSVRVIAEIREEGLTGRQLRNARRLAQRHGISVTSDLDAVRALRERGIDPLQRDNMLQLVSGDKPSPSATSSTSSTEQKGESPVQLPQTVRAEAPLPAQPISPMAARAREVQDMQRDITRRRRRRLWFLAMRLVAFVFLPTILAGYYYFAVATPLYATKSSLRIDQANSQATGGGLGSILGGTGLATSQDAVGVQDYLLSLAAMLRLEQEEVGFRKHFSGDAVDVLQRLPDGATNEDAYKLYQRLVKIGYDPTEGVIRMEVSAPEPELAVAFANHLIVYAEEQADSLTQKMREDQMSGANEALMDAESKMSEAQARVLALQEELGVLDPASETTSLMTQITGFETQLAEKRLQLEQLRDNTAPNAARVAGTEGDIARLQALIDDLRGQMTDATRSDRSLARISGELSMAEVDLETRTMMMQEALRQVESARIEANRQVTYVTPIVSPVVPEKASYPRAFENTLLAFLIFSGLYLLVSITISILREQT